MFKDKSFEGHQAAMIQGGIPAKKIERFFLVESTMMSGSNRINVRDLYVAVFRAVFWSGSALRLFFGGLKFEFVKKSVVKSRTSELQAQWTSLVVRGALISAAIGDSVVLTCFPPPFLALWRLFCFVLVFYIVPLYR